MDNKPMTAKERAAQIWCKPYMASKEMDIQLAELIAAEIKAAVEADRNARTSDDLYQAAYRRGVEEERAACAKVVSDFLLYSSQRAVSWHEVNDAIEAIRARTVEPHKAGEEKI